MTNRRILFFIATVAWMGLIFYLSSIPDLQSGLSTLWDTIVRKIAHAVEYGILFYFIAGSIDAKGKPRRAQLAAALSILYAISDEYHQGFVEGRVGSPIDVLIDSGGVAVAYIASKKRISHRIS